MVGGVAEGVRRNNRIRDLRRDWHITNDPPDCQARYWANRPLCCRERCCSQGSFAATPRGSVRCDAELSSRVNRQQTSDERGSGAY